MNREGNTTLFGLPFEKDSAVLRDQNMIIGWDFGEPDVPFINVPPPSVSALCSPRHVLRVHCLSFLIRGVAALNCDVRWCDLLQEYDTHEFTRRTPTAQAMTARWFHQNEAFNACGGACKQSPPV